MKHDITIILRMAQVRSKFPHKQYMREYELFKGGIISEDDRAKVRAVWGLRISDEPITSAFETIYDNITK